MIRMSGKDVPMSAESEAGALAILRALRDVPEPHRLDALGLAVDVACKTDSLTRWPYDNPLRLDRWGRKDEQAVNEGL